MGPNDGPRRIRNSVENPIFVWDAVSLGPPIFVRPKLSNSTS